MSKSLKKTKGWLSLSINSANASSVVNVKKILVLSSTLGKQLQICGRGNRKQQTNKTTAALARWLSWSECRPVYKRSRVQFLVRAHMGGNRSIFLSHTDIPLSLKSVTYPQVRTKDNNKKPTHSQKPVYTNSPAFYRGRYRAPFRVAFITVPHLKLCVALLSLSKRSDRRPAPGQDEGLFQYAKGNLLSTQTYSAAQTPPV